MRSKFIFTLAVICGLSFSVVQAQQVAKISAGGTAYLEYVPQDYNQNNNDYPIVIFLHGVGEKGTTSTDPATLKNSAQKVANVGLAKNVKYGTQYPFILISPQLKSNYSTWPANYVIEVLNHVKKYLRVNERRIYITGLSLGGFGTWTTLGAYPGVFAASIPICSGGSALSKACAIAAEDVALWAFHGTNDGIVSYTVTTKMINAVNNCTPKPSPLAKYTLFDGMGHGIWDKVYKQTNALDWMLSFTNGTTSGTTDGSTTTNNPPVVSAGSDKSLALPDNEIYIQGTASDSDGSIASYKWSKISGPSASLGAYTTSKLRAYNLLEGSYTFRLTVKDNQGAYKSDDVKVTVSAGSTNTAPVVSAGSDRSLTLPTNEIYLQGSASDSDGSIASYTWTKVSGPSASLGAYTTSKLRAYNLLEGSYTFRLTVKDNQGAYKSDDVKVTVSAGSTNTAPVVSAGSDRSLTLPTNEIYLQGTASDSDGSIVSYLWTKIAGPYADRGAYTTSRLRAYNLVEGAYTFRLTVKDNQGAYRSDDVNVTVSGSSTTTTESSTTTSGSSTTNNPPVVSAGSDRSLTLPTNEIYLQGTASDSDGSIVSYLWTKIAGPYADRGAYTTSRLRAYNLVEGAYTFRLTVKDNQGAYRSDDVNVTVSGSSTTTTESSTTTSGSSTTNNPPVVSAGSDKFLTLPTNQVYLQGTASDSDGSIVSYLWTKIAGPHADRGAYTTSRLRAYNLVEGAYTFRLTVKDNQGAYRSDDVKVTVSDDATASNTTTTGSGGSTANISPTAYAGADKATSSNSITISGSGSDQDGEIVAYKWLKYYGGAVALKNANTRNVTVDGMKDGKYFLRLTVTDNQGATDYDNMQIVVNGSAATAYNIAPVSNAGPDKRITEDISTLRLTGSGIDKDGKIVSYKWSQYGGPDVDLNNVTSSTVSVSGLDEGKYYLRLTVKDNDGAVDYDNMLIVVNES